MGQQLTTRERLDALYAELPTIECQGKCAESCGPIFMSRYEWKRICRSLKTVPVATSLTCPMLKDDRCTVYAIRPMICRLWGIVDSMACPFGCKPSPRYLTHAEGHAFLDRADRIGR